VYSFGVVLLEIITGKPPLQGPNCHILELAVSRVQAEGYTSVLAKEVLPELEGHSGGQGQGDCLSAEEQETHQTEQEGVLPASSGGKGSFPGASEIEIVTEEPSPDPQPATSTQPDEVGAQCSLTEDACQCVVSLALMCCHTNPRKRPSMYRVAEVLEELRFGSSTPAGFGASSTGKGVPFPEYAEGERAGVTLADILGMTDTEHSDDTGVVQGHPVSGIH